MGAGYILARVKVTNPQAWAEYAKYTPRVIAKFGGRFLVRGGSPRLLEGEAEPERIVLIEFPSSAQAQAFFDSPDYQAVRALREGAGEGVFLLLEGYPGDEWRTVLAASQALGPPGNSR